jgi:signal transduction histidine kinase/CheY-like chemotaxis protein
MRDGHKALVSGVIAAGAIFVLRSLLAPLLFSDPSPWQWVAREIPIYATLAVFCLVAYRILRRRRALVEASEQSRQASDIRDRISMVFLTVADEKVYSEVLKVILEATRSKHGVFGYLNDNGDLICPSLRDHPWNLWNTDGKRFAAGRSTWGGLWGQALIERRLQCSNGDAGATEGHGPMQRAVALPVLYKENPIGLIMVGDRPADYEAADREILQSIAGHISPILGVRLERSAAAGKLIESGSDKQRAQVRILQEQRIKDIGVVVTAMGDRLDRLISSIGSGANPSAGAIDAQRPLRRDLEELHEARLGATNLIHQLLFFSSKHPYQVAPMNPNIVLHEMLKTMGGLVGKGIQVDACLDPEIWAVLAERSAIRQVVLNLAANARAAVSAGGHIRIETENVELKQGQFEMISGARPGNFVCISITDDGRGMDKQELKRVFEPFFTTKEDRANPGIGLSVAHAIVDQHEGWINAYSEPGRGSTFKVYLPALSIAAPERDDTRIPLEEFRGRGEKILLVEDEDEIREMITTILTENGYVVTPAAAATQALSIFRKENGEFDLLLSDVVLPDENGIRLADRLTCLKPGLPVLLTSGYMDAEGQRLITCEKGYGFLSKPFSVAAILRVIVESVASRPAPQEVTAPVQ